jgi:hypothetical protein
MTAAGAALLLLTVAVPAMAAEPGTGAAVPEYRRTAGGFTCAIAAPATFGAARQTIVRDTECRKVGPLAIGMLRADAEMSLGMPSDMQMTGGNQYFLYGLKAGADGMPVTYAVIAYDYDGKTVIIQLTGEAWDGAWRFNGITLGDTEQAVLDKLGAAFLLRRSNVTDAVLWSYAPWPFTIELTAGIVTAIRITAQ